MGHTNCARCGHANGQGPVFCVRCGSPLKQPGGAPTHKQANVTHANAPGAHADANGAHFNANGAQQVSHAAPRVSYAAQQGAHAVPNPPHAVTNPPQGVVQGVSLGAQAAPAVVGVGQPASLPVDFPAAPFESIGDVLRPTYRLYRDNFLLVGKIVAVALLPLIAARYALPGLGESLSIYDPGSAVAAFLFAKLSSVFVTSLMTAALTYAVIRLLRTGASPGVGEAYGFAAGRWLKVFGCTILLNILTGAGLMLFLIPGLYLMTVFAVAVPAIVVEDCGPVAALERSAELTRGYRMLILVTLALLWLVVSLVTWLVVAPGLSGAGAGESFVSALVYSVTAQMLSSAFTVLSLFTYLGILADKSDKALSYLSAAPSAAPRY